MIIHGDLFDVLPTLAAERFDCCVTDPPYGIGFMGREWDTFKPSAMKDTNWFQQVDRLKKAANPNIRGRKHSPALSPSQIDYDRSVAGLRGFQVWTERWAVEVLRVLKPGAHLVVCGAPRSHHRMMCGLEDAGFEIRDCLAWLFGQGFPKSRNLGEGWGTALKPGHEPIALARKPFKGTTTANHRKHKVGGLNVDACKIEGDVENRGGWANAGYVRPRTAETFTEGTPVSSGLAETLGRWPANVLLDEDAAELLDAQSGDLHARGNDGPSKGGGGLYGHGPCLNDFGPGDAGGASRFFYVAKPSTDERNLGCDTRNIHPTVKPLALMRWLVRLVTPAGGIVLDPFGGSGTTAMACAAEGLDFVLIEREAAYVPIIEARVRSIAPLFTEGIDSERHGTDEVA